MAAHTTEVLPGCPPWLSTLAVLLSKLSSANPQTEPRPHKVSGGLGLQVWGVKSVTAVKRALSPRNVLTGLAWQAWQVWKVTVQLQAW